MSVLSNSSTANRQACSYKPATMKIDVKVSFCLLVVRRRHSKGIGFFRISDRFSRICVLDLYHQENQCIQCTINSTGDQEEQIDIHTPSMHSVFKVPKGMYRNAEVRIRKYVGPAGKWSAYHWKTTINTKMIVKQSTKAVITSRMIRSWATGKILR